MGDFRESKEYELLNTIGIKCGHIIVKSQEPLFVIDLEVGERMLSSGVAYGILTTADAQKIRTQMTKVGICENMMSVLEKIREFTIPDDTPNQLYVFQKCNSPTCKQPAIHGNIFFEQNGEKAIDQELTTLNMGYALCFVNMTENKMSPLNAVIILKQMLEANLVADGPELKKPPGELPS